MTNLIIISGVAGGGKTYALSIFEENGYFIIDNVPLKLIKNLFDLFKDEPEKYKKVALAVKLNEAKQVREISKEYDFDTSFVGINCSKEVLLERYKLSRRVHPFQAEGLTLEESIDRDKKIIESIRDEFSHYVDTSKLTTGQFRKYLYTHLLAKSDSKMSVNFLSFAYKKSVPQDVELVFDARLLPNPYWIAELKELCGLDEDVKEYIFNSDITKEFLDKIISYLDYYLEMASEKGRKIITVGIACSGGQHRSVAIAEYLKEHYAKKYNTSSSHRDLAR